MTDYTFYCPTILSDQSIALYASHVPVYSYIFNHPSPAGGSEPHSALERECKTHACKLSIVLASLVPRLSPEDDWGAHKAGESLGGFARRCHVKVDMIVT